METSQYEIQRPLYVVGIDCVFKLFVNCKAKIVENTRSLHVPSVC